MSRRIFLSLAILLVLINSSISFGETKDFEKFSVNVPEGWSASQDGSTVGIIADDKSASISITIAETDGVSIDDLAVAFSAQLGGTVPEKDDDGDYTFDFNSGISNAMLTGDDEYYMLIVISGAENAEETLEEILESIKIKE